MKQRLIRLWKWLDNKIRGEIVITMNDQGECVCVTRQVGDGRTRAVVWQKFVGATKWLVDPRRTERRDPT